MTDGLADDGAENLPPSTAPENFPLSVSGGFESEEQAKKFASDLGAVVHVISRVINLERLDGVTVADDYDGALQKLDRGVLASRPLSRSNNERITGVAMSPAVLRKDVVKAHLLFFTPAIRGIGNGNDLSEFNDALYTIAHECGHVEDLKHRDEAFPGVILRKGIVRYDEGAIEQVTEVIWEEYAACRASAPFAGEKQISAYVASLSTMLDGARDRSNAAIRAFRLHGDVNRGVQETGEHIFEPLRMFAYLLGTLDGLKRYIKDDAPDADRAIAESPYTTIFSRTTDILRLLWARRGQWLSLAEFDPLRQVVRDALEEGGVIFTVKPDGSVRVDLPFRPGTMPWDT